MLSPQTQAGCYWARKRNRLSTALSDDLIAPAWGTVIFSANPSAGHTVTINGAVITFGDTVAIGASLELTMAAAVAYVTENPITGVTVAVTGNGLLIESVTPGAAIEFSASNATCSAPALQVRKLNQRVPL